MATISPPVLFTDSFDENNGKILVWVENKSTKTQITFHSWFIFFTWMKGVNVSDWTIVNM
jgi:hypothetical protein